MSFEIWNMFAKANNYIKVDLLVDIVKNWHQEYSKTNGDREGDLIEIETFWKAHP